MDFLSSLHTDVQLLMVAGALALLAGLFSGSRRNEFRYIVVFAVMMGTAGWRYQQEQAQDLAASAERTDTAANQVTRPAGKRAPAN